MFYKFICTTVEVNKTSSVKVKVYKNDPLEKLIEMVSFPRFGKKTINVRLLIAANVTV